MSRRSAPESRERLIESTRSCIRRFGLSKTTLEDVAREAKFSRATVYRYFPEGRDQLVRELLESEIEQFARRLAGATAGTNDLELAVSRALSFVRSEAKEQNLLQSLVALEPERVLPLLNSQLVQILNLFRNFLEDPLQHALGTGRLRPGLDLELTKDYVARMLLSFLQSAGTYDFEDPDEIELVARTRILGGVLAVRTSAA